MVFGGIGDLGYGFVKCWVDVGFEVIVGLCKVEKVEIIVVEINVEKLFCGICGL